MEITIIVKEGLVQEVYAEDPNVIVEVLDLDNEYTDRDETELGALRELAEDARKRLHSVW